MILVMFLVTNLLSEQNHICLYEMTQFLQERVALLRELPFDFRTPKTISKDLDTR